MNPQFSQPKGSVSKETNKESIARCFGCKKSEVVYAKTGQSLSGYKVIYDKATERAYALPANLGAVTITSITDGILTHSSGTVDLGALAVLRGECVNLVEDFTSGFTIRVKNEVVSDGTYLYRWAGALPKTVAKNSTPATAGGVAVDAWVLVDQVTLRSQLSAPTGSDLVGYRLTTTAVARSVTKALAEKTSLYDFGDSTVDAGNSANLALSFLTTEGDIYARGGTLTIPRGFHTVNTTVLLDRTAGGADVTDGFTIIGDGAGTSELRAGSGLSAVSAIVKSNEPTGNPIQLYRLAHFSTRGGYNGIRLETASRGSIERVKVENSTDDGIYIGNSWVNNIDGVLVNNAGANGVNFDATKQKTSTVVSSGYVNKSAYNGWVWGFMNYSAAIGVAADAAGLNGHHIKNSEGFAMIACGNEAAQRSGIYVEASTAIGANRSITIQNHFSHNGNLSNGGWANLLHAKSTNGVDNKVTIRNSTSHTPNYGIQDIIADGLGTIVTIDDCILPNGWDSTNGGYIDWVQHNVLINQITFGAGSARTIARLRSTQGHSETYGGMLVVHVGNNSPASPSGSTSHSRKTATYVLLINKSQTSSAVTVVEMGKAGDTEGAVADQPSFTWSVNDLNQLVATSKTATTAGTFWFEFSAQGQIVVSKVS